MTEKFRPFWFDLCVILVICSFSWLAGGQEISPALEQQRIVAEEVESSQPAATNSTEAGRALNRRVEIAVATAP